MTFPLPLRKAAFVYPLGRPPRTAVLGPWFRNKGILTNDPVRVFPTGWSAEAAAYAPQAIAATRQQLLDLAPHAPAITHALIAIALGLLLAGYMDGKDAKLMATSKDSSAVASYSVTKQGQKLACIHCGER